MKPCEFAIAVGNCGKPATHARHVVVKTILKGNLHEWSPPDAFYCERHTEFVRKWNNGSNPQISATITRLQKERE